MTVLRIPNRNCKRFFVLAAAVPLLACSVLDGSRVSDIQESSIPERSQGSANSEIQTVRHYIEKLSDRNYVETYGDADNPRPWYTAAEALGAIGMPAIPALVARLGTNDQYELKLVLYALMLASQDPALKLRLGNDYLKLNTVLTEESNSENRQRAVQWWQRHRNLFSDKSVRNISLNDRVNEAIFQV